MKHVIAPPRQWRRTCSHSKLPAAHHHFARGSAATPRHACEASTHQVRIRKNSDLFDEASIRVLEQKRSGQHATQDGGGYASLRTKKKRPRRWGALGARVIGASVTRWSCRSSLPPEKRRPKDPEKGGAGPPSLPARTVRTHARGSYLFVLSSVRFGLLPPTNGEGRGTRSRMHARRERPRASFTSFSDKVSSSSYQPKTSQQNNKRVKTGNQPARPSRFSRDLKRGGERARETAVRFAYATCAQLSGSQCALRRHSRRVFEGALSW